MIHLSFQKQILKAALLMLVPLFLIGCASKQAWQFKTQYFGISVNDKGYITSMKNITTKQ